MLVYIFSILLLISLPGTLELLFLTVMAWLGGRKMEKSVRLSIIKLAVIIPAHNEEQGISNTLESIMLCENPPDKKDIVVIVDNCTDNTASIANNFGVTVLMRNDDTKRGKGFALNYAFNNLLESCDHDGFVVVDADTYVDKNIFNEFRVLFGGGGDAGQALNKVKNPEVSVRTRLMNISFMAFDMLRPLARSNAGLSVGIHGNGFGLSRATVLEVPYSAFSIVEDLEYHLRLIRSGKVVRLLMNTAVRSDTPIGVAEAKSQRERWDGGRFVMCRELVPQLLKDVFVKRKIELIEPLFELLLLPLAFHLMLILPLFLSGNIFIFTYAVFALLAVVAHVLSAMIIGKAEFADYKALASVPFYVLWKLFNLKGILKMTARGADWKRTGR